MSEYMNPRLPTGAAPIDELLGGGIEYAAVTNVYGPAGSGKTNVALMAAVSAARAGEQVIFIDTEGGFSPERMAQLCEGARERSSRQSGTSGSVNDAEDVSKRILILEPKSFDEQQAAVKKLEKMVPKKDVGLVVIDSLVALYRLEMNHGGHVDANKRLSEQLSILSNISRDENIPVLVTNQIYSDFDSGGIEIVSRDVAKYWSKCLLELQKAGDDGQRVATIRKHRSLPEGKQAQFTITANGVAEAKGFKLFG